MVKECKRNNPRAQKCLYELLSPAMFAVCLRYSNCEDDAQENFQLAFIKVFKNVNKFNDNGSFEGWVRRIMVNQCIDSIRKKKRDNWVEIHENSILEEEETELINDFSLQEILSCIKKLPPQYRLVFNMFMLEEYTHKEIARELGISENTSKSNLHRAKAKLREELMKLKLK